MKSIETTEGQAESHFRVAVHVYEKALEMFNEGPDRTLARINPDFRSARFQIENLLAEAEDNLNYAVDFGMSDVDSVTKLQKKVNDLKQKLKDSKPNN